MEGLTRGAVAKRAGVNAQTVRYYERRGLLPPPPRSLSNYRLYPGEAVERVRFVKRAQGLGFTLEEIRGLLSLRASPRGRCADVLHRASGKIQEIDRKVRDLLAMKKALRRLVRECTGKGPVTECPILVTLETGGGMRSRIPFDLAPWCKAQNRGDARNRGFKNVR